MNNMKTKSIVMYGAEWCRDCRRAKAYLDQHHIPYVYVDMEANEDAVEKVTELNNGYQKIPILVLPDNTVLIEPSDEELREKVTVG